MKTLVCAGLIALGVLCVAPGFAAAQEAATAACPAGTPASPRPAPDFVPTSDCIGWIPASHPLAGPGPVTGPAPTCTVATLRGSFVFAATGFNIVAGVSQPKAIIEVIEFHGDGTLAVPAATLSVNGAIVRSPPSVGTYTVDDGCTGTVSFNGPTYDTFLSKTGDRLSMIQTNPNTVFQGVASRNPD